MAFSFLNEDPKFLAAYFQKMLNDLEQTHNLKPIGAMLCKTGISVETMTLDTVCEFLGGDWENGRVQAPEDSPNVCFVHPDTYMILELFLDSHAICLNQQLWDCGFTVNVKWIAQDITFALTMGVPSLTLIGCHIKEHHDE